MHLSYHKLKNNQKAIAIYAFREVKIYSGFVKQWFNCTAFNQSKEGATVYLLLDALDVAENLNNANIEFHFIDEIGDAKPDIKDFNEEDIYNCPNFIRFDRFKLGDNG